MSISSHSSREKWLLNFMPAALVLAIYAFVFAVPAQKRNSASANKLVSTKATAVSAEVADQSRQNLVLAKAGLEKLNLQIRDDRDQIEFLGKQWSDRQARLSTVQQVTELLQQVNLSIVSQDFEQDPQLPDYLNELAEIIARHSGEEESLGYWRIELTGGYADMMKFLNQIKSSGMRTFPITLSMQSSENGDGLHAWTVVFVV